jgi:hypothetical protein
VGVSLSNENAKNKRGAGLCQESGRQTICQVALSGLGWTTPQHIKARKLISRRHLPQGVQSANSVVVDGKQDKDEALSIKSIFGRFARDGITRRGTNLCSKTGLHIKVF